MYLFINYTKRTFLIEFKTKLVLLKNLQLVSREAFGRYIASAYGKLRRCALNTKTAIKFVRGIAKHGECVDASQPSNHPPSPSINVFVSVQIPAFFTFNFYPLSRLKLEKNPLTCELLKRGEKLFLCSETFKNN